MTEQIDGRASFAVLAGAGAAAAVGGAAAGWRLAMRRERKQWSRLHRTLVELLLNALSSGDPVTARHCRRVANLTDALAGALGIEQREHATLRVAALLHDLGKIEDELFPLVHSPDPLTEAEREQINHHPFTSAHILEPLESFHHGLTAIVTSHHECWNGRGYPHGLAGERIPLGARIITIADVFDALCQPRSYHAPRPIREVLATIRRGGGERFDPALVRLLDIPEVRSAFLRIAEEGRREEEEAASQNEE
jgi:putative nucleotidyltransferase with HDIG domain